MAALVPLCSVTPMHPLDYTYDPSHPNLPYGCASVLTYGGHTSVGEWDSLSSQAARDRLVLKYNAVPESDLTLGPMLEYRGQCVVEVMFSGRNVGTSHQYLVLFSLQGVGIAQIFLNHDFLQAEEMGGGIETMAILLACPGNGVSVYPHLRLAAYPNQHEAELAFKGMECYLL